MSNKIIFKNRLVGLDIEKPVPAKKNIPEWYKNLRPFINGEKKPLDINGNVSVAQTMKKCMPVLDALSSGYLIKTYTDIYVEEVNGSLKYFWPTDHVDKVISFHVYDQIEGHPFFNTGDWAAKFVNVWGITTPKGYSCLFIPPVHRDNIITILPGVVDTDKYNVPVEFPFMLTDPNFTGLIPLGTPIAQVIPFKRESWEASFGEDPGYKNETFKFTNMFFDKYKSVAWHRKEYN